MTRAPGGASPSVAILTLGCGRNEVDSDQLAGMLSLDGLPVIDDPSQADVVLVNTCTFIEPAKQESIDTVLAACDLKDAGVRAVLVVGCMAQRYPHELADAIPEADAVVGFDAYPRLGRLIRDVVDGRPHDRILVTRRTRLLGSGRVLPLASAAPSYDRRVLDLDVPERDPGDALEPTGQDDLDHVPASGPRFPVRAFDGRAWAYLKIASGCDRLCTFCAIPSFRGGFRSRPLDEILAEASWLTAHGARELVLVSENTTSWGKDLTVGGRDLQPKLLGELSAIDGVERIRLMYLQPAELTWPLLEAMTGLPKVASYFDLSLQHVSADLLRRMARGGSAQAFLRLIREIRALDDHAAFRSNFILGFPGETEDNVAELEAFLEEARLDWVGLFTFSVEDGTPSATFEHQVPAEVARERRRRVSELQEGVADQVARSYVGRTLQVLVEEVDGACVGRSHREAPDTDGEVRLVASHGTVPQIPVGRMVTATVRAADGVDLVGEVVAEPGR